MTGAEREQEALDTTRSFIAASRQNGHLVLRKLQRGRAAAGEATEPRIKSTSQPTAHEALLLQAEAMAGVLEEMAKRVHLLRDELWRLRAALAPQGGQR